MTYANADQTHQNRFYRRCSDSSWDKILETNQIDLKKVEMMNYFSNGKNIWDIKYLYSGLAWENKVRNILSTVKQLMAGSFPYHL